MKQMKNLWVALVAVVMSMSVTSCMNGDENTIVQLTSFVRVVNDLPLYFKDSSGTKLIPTTMITSTANESLALIYYQYDRATVAENATSINITLLIDPVYIKESHASSSATPANAPVITVEPATAYGTVKGGFFDKNTLILPVAYKFKKYDKSEDALAEQNRHSFDVSYNPDTYFENGILTLRLCHRAEPILGSDEKPVERTDQTYEYKAFNLNYVLSSLSAKPTKVNIIIDKNESNDKFGEGNTSDMTYSFEYLFKD